MRLDTRDEGRVTVLSIRGDLAGDDADTFCKTATSRLDQSTHDFVLDVEAMDYIDSRGLEAMLWLKDEAEARLGQVRLAGVSETLRQALRLTRLSQVFDTHSSVAEALHSLE